VGDQPKRRLSFEELLAGVDSTSILNEPLAPEQAEDESASARAARRWFKRDRRSDG
jgi:hypothetical protein